MAVRIKMFFTSKPSTLTPWLGMLCLLAALGATQVTSNISPSQPSDPSKPNTQSPDASSQTQSTVLPDVTQPTPSNPTSQPRDENTQSPDITLTPSSVPHGIATEGQATPEKPDSLPAQNSTDGIHGTSITEATTQPTEENPIAIMTSKPDSTLSPSITTLQYTVTTISTTLSPKSAESNNTINCTSLRDLISTSKVVCFMYPEDKTCETLEEEKKKELLQHLCGIIQTTDNCHITFHSSEVVKGCILWVPNSQDAEDRLMGESSGSNEFPIPKTLGQISDHQTRSQKTMIALVTCGVLLAFFILTGYFLSNRDSFSPGRQRLGEDTYYTDTDSQGNTLVSVSTNNLEKPNKDTKENGKGQNDTPSATNGHTKKKKNVSDTEL